MAFRLPQQEEKVGTYMEDPEFEWLIQNRLVAGQSEAQTNRVWIMILTDIFKRANGYSTGSEMTFGDGRADLFTAHVVVRTRHKEMKFLIVECKPPNQEGQDEVWETAAKQLHGYLMAIASPNRKFGAISVRKYVRFYELVDDEYSVDCKGDGNVYRLDRQCQSVTAKLLYFQSHHLPAQF
ncbi:hypothetical protein SAPIO_CDS1690 [Scedosporium apiospermum]|uniref:Type I restriction enzyme R protein N-terminal domain-containing protein n=1 Tax=Pseudallescheria apiosperma TaxID=563466 RepID=A0A084GDI8_PSEDA|nr:uncharacterized protein SAPIO_CDS1690 [Scedosporium apiospermum]KEZ45400.1 hypothetical protein SAPIO_CDS1690 [Scedosporium apiospermum]